MVGVLIVLLVSGVSNKSFTTRSQSQIAGSGAGAGTSERGCICLWSDTGLGCDDQCVYAGCWWWRLCIKDWCPADLHSLLNCQ